MEEYDEKGASFRGSASYNNPQIVTLNLLRYIIYYVFIFLCVYIYLHMYYFIHIICVFYMMYICTYIYIMLNTIFV